MSAARIPSARSIRVSRRSGSIGSGQTGLPMRISPPCRELWKARRAYCYLPQTPACSIRPSSLWGFMWKRDESSCSKSGYGNFHMKPNGVFYISVDGAAVAETGAFLKQRPRAELATQSGPMLVINGRVHPRFDRRSTSLKARNGVGVRADGKVIFAISQGEVSFDAFARLFRDGLNCPNALFLDGGSAASLYAPSLNSHGNIVSLGPMLAVFEKNRGASRQ